MPTVTVIKPGIAPTLIFTPKTFEEIRYIVQNSHEEVGWLFTVDKDKNGNFTITEVFTPLQYVNGAETDIEADEYLNWYNALEKAGKDPAEHLYGWGHSHVDGITSPSAQDETQFMQYGGTCPFFIRTIHNKKGDIRVDIALFEQNLLYTNCEWHVKYATLTKQEQEVLSKQLEMNVKRRTFSGPHNYNDYDDCNGTGYYNKKNKKGKNIITTLDPNKTFDDYSSDELKSMPDNLYYALFNNYHNIYKGNS